MHGSIAPDPPTLARLRQLRLGIGVGISAGANFLGALRLIDAYGDDAVVVTVFPDDNKKYLSTDLLREEEVRDGYLSPAIELVGFRAYKRVCQTCCEPGDCFRPRGTVELAGSHPENCPKPG